MTQAFLSLPPIGIEPEHGRTLIAIDPGTERSAFVLYAGGRVLEHGHEPNDVVLAMLQRPSTASLLVVEMIASYGMAVGFETFETCVWIGRFCQAWAPRDFRRMPRMPVKMHLCGQARAKDGNIRQALIDRYGGKERAVGRKASPGPLYGVSGDEWAALAVAVTASETIPGGQA